MRFGMARRNHPDLILSLIRVGHDKEPPEAVSAKRNKPFLAMLRVFTRKREDIRKDVFQIGKIYLVPFKVDFAPDGIVGNLHGLYYTDNEK